MTKFYNQNMKRLVRFDSKYKTIESLIENLFLKSTITSYQYLRSSNITIPSKENDIRDLFVRDFKRRNPLIKDYISNNTISFSSENQAYTKNERERTDTQWKLKGQK